MKPALSRAEFVAMVAMMSATIAFSIDAMLPALPEIGAALSPDDPNLAQLVITSFVLGMGIGTLFTGPLSDAFGRKPVIVAGSALYIAAALVASVAQSLEVLIAARIAQGIGASGPRVAAIALVRDAYAGRGMARITSFVMIVFTIVPAVAPLIGAGIIHLSGWRAVFWAFVVFSLISTLWVGLRQPETLARENRRPFRFANLRTAGAEMFANPVVRIAIAGQVLAFGMLFSMLSSVQQIYDITFGKGETFPVWFGAVALVSGSSGFLNASLVMKFGMRRLVRSMLSVQIVLSAALGLIWVSGLPTEITFYAFVLWQTAVFFQAGMTIGNLQALALEPMGHIAGFASSILGSVATLGGAMLAIPVGLMFDGTPLPLSISIGVQAVLGVWLMLRLARVDATT